MPATSWSAPASFSSGDTLNAAHMNAIGDNLKFLKNADRVRAYDTAGQTVTNVTWEAVSFDAEDYDTNALHDGGSNPSRLTAKTDGWYLVFGQVEWDTNATGRRNLQIRKNDTTSDATGGSRWAYDSAEPAGADETYQQIFSSLYLSVNDHVRMFAYQTSGGGLAINPGSGVTWFSMTWQCD